MNGVVASFNSHRGLGYISVGDDQYLFHCAELVDLTREIEVGTMKQILVVAHGDIAETSVAVKTCNDTVHDPRRLCVSNRAPFFQSWALMRGLPSG